MIKLKEAAALIEARNLTKKYDGFTAVDNIDLTIKNSSVFGLVGTNGAGKSTFLKMAAGILKPDAGSITIDGDSIFEKPLTKERFFYISDDQYFFQNAFPDELMHFYVNVYPSFDRERFGQLIKAFELPQKRKIGTYSKGMKKLLAIIYGLSARTPYLFCDETFDGLDPVMRQAVKSLIAGDMADRGLTPVITSHNLRELEDICDHVGLLHKGGILLSEELDEMKINIHKVQCVLRPENSIRDLDGLDIIISEKRGSLLTLTIRGSESEISSYINALEPVFYEMVPLTLEEIFISETEVKGYDIKKLIL